MLSWQADRRGVHVEHVLREAVGMYLLSVRPGYRLQHTIIKPAREPAEGE